MKKTLLLFILIMVTAGTSAQGKKGKFNLGFTLFALAVLTTFLLLFLVKIGKI